MEHHAGFEHFAYRQFSRYEKETQYDDVAGGRALAFGSFRNREGLMVAQAQVTTFSPNLPAGFMESDLHAHPHGARLVDTPADLLRRAQHRSTSLVDFSTFLQRFRPAGVKAGEPGLVAVFEERPEEYAGRAATFGIDLKSRMADGSVEVIYLRRSTSL